jgi:hypothetical protein
MQLIPLVSERQQDMIDDSKKDVIQNSLDAVKKTLQPFSQAMIDFVKEPKIKEKQDIKNQLAIEISSAIGRIIETLSPSSEETNTQQAVGAAPIEETQPLALKAAEHSDDDDIIDDDDSDDESIFTITNTTSTDSITIANQMNMVKHQLLKSKECHIKPELDKYISAIIKNSKSVAEESKSHFKEKILQLCDEVLILRQKLTTCYEEYNDNPDSEEKKSAFHDAVDQLCSKLEELDVVVAESVAHQIAETFVSPSAAIDTFVDKVSSSQVDDESQSNESVEGLRTTVEVFRRHSKRLSEVALHAAQGTLSRRHSMKIKNLSNKLDDLTQKVVDAAIEVRKEPQNNEARQLLNSLRKEWAEQVRALTEAIDEIINVETFAAATEANIVDDMMICREAIDKRNWDDLALAVHNIAAKARRVSDVVKNKLPEITDIKLRNSVRDTIKALEISVRDMFALLEKLMRDDPPDEDTLTRFIKSLEHVLQSIQNVQQAIPDIKEPTSAGRSFPITPANVHYKPQSTSTPIEVQTQKPQDETSSSSSSESDASPPPLRPLPPVSDVHMTPNRYREMVTPLSSDNWIKEGSFETTPSSFAPTNPSESRNLINMNEAQDYVEFQPMMRYPSSFGGGFSFNPSFGATGMQSEGSPEKSSELRPPAGRDSLMKVCSQPLQNIIIAANQKDPRQLNEHAAALSKEAEELIKLGEAAANSAKDTGLAQALSKESAMLNYLTPRVIKKAEEVLHNDDDNVELKEGLELLVQQWAGHVHKLMETTYDVNMPWSRSARRLVSSAKTRKGLKKEISHINMQTEKMVDIASTSVKAATVEDAIGSTGNLDHEPDEKLQEEIEKLQGHIKDMQTITPSFITTAQGIADADTVKREEEEQLNLLSHNWATKAHVLMKDVDEITIGMSGPVDSLLIAANSKDLGLLNEQAESIMGLAKSMKAVSQDSIEGCEKEDEVKLVMETAELLQSLSVDLVTCANEIVTVSAHEEQHHAIMEKIEILRREWAAKMHLLTAYIDDLTARVAGPLDRLVSVALQASRTEGMAKDHLMGKFEQKEEFINDQLDTVKSKLNNSVDQLKASNNSLQNCLRSLNFLQKVSPHAIGAAKSLSSDPGSAKLDHFSHLRRQWASKAQYFFANLLSVNQHQEDIDVSDVISSFEDLLQGYVTTKSTPSKAKPKRQEDHTVQPRYYSTEDIEEISRSPAHGNTSLNEYSSPYYKWSPQPPGPSRSYFDDNSLLLEGSLNKSRSIAVAAKSLHDAANEFMEEGNPLVSIAKQMSNQMYQMAEFVYRRGSIKSMPEMIKTARDICKSAQELVNYANMISEQCTDKRMKSNLQHRAEILPTLSNQLNIIASVKEANPDDINADIMLTKNAQNLMDAVIQMIQAAEAAYVKGLKPPDDSEDNQASQLAIEWKKNLYYKRTLESMNAQLGAKGLRRLNKLRYSVVEPIPQLETITK